VNKQEPQSNIFKQLINNWPQDLLAGTTVALVALPLAIGISLAVGMNPISGVVSVVVAGLLTTFIRGGHIAINGPANSLIVVVGSAFALLEPISDNPVSLIMGAFVVSGILQILMGVFKLGKISDFFPSSVVNGLLAAIGIIIFIKQIHIVFGNMEAEGSNYELILSLPATIMELNPFVTLISLVSLIILFSHQYIKSKFIHFLPAPLLVLLASVPLVYLFDFFEARQIDIWWHDFHVGPQYLVSIPEKIFAGLTFPSFEALLEPRFWLAVLIINIITTIETLVSAKAVDRIDPQKRKTNYNKDLAAMGISTGVSAFLGGLPVIAVIVRSSVNVNHGARTRWSNLFHGLIMGAMVLFLAPLIRQIPMAALASILGFAGYKLAAPRKWYDTLLKGWEQFLIMLITCVVTIKFGMIVGLITGVLTTLVIHMLQSGLPLPVFMNYIINPSFRFIEEKEKNLLFRIKGVANFANILRLIGRIESLPKEKHIIMDFSRARLVDHTVLELVHEQEEMYIRNGGEFDITGLDVHRASSYHPLSLHVNKPPKPVKIRLTSRQQKLKTLASEKGWAFDPVRDWYVDDVQDFIFFQTKPIQYKKNEIKGVFDDLDVNWEISDVTFDEGALLTSEVYHTTIQFLEIPFKLPVFSLEKDALVDRLMMMTGQHDINFESYKTFSERYSLRGPDEEAIKSFFNESLLSFFEESGIYHLESKGRGLLIFRYLRIASPVEIEEMVEYSHNLTLRLFDRYEKNNFQL